APGTSDVSIDNDGPTACLRHQFDKLARLIQVVQEAATEDYIEDAIRREILDIIMREGQVGQMSSGFDPLTLLEIAFPNLDAQCSKTLTREFDGIATLKTAQIGNPFASDAIRKHHPQELLRELK